MAITEYYVRSDAAGGGNGTTNANSGANGAFTWAELSARMSGGAAAAGDRYNIKSGTYSLSATDTWTNDGTTVSPIVFRGFYTSPGDLDTQGRTGGNGALNTTNFPVISYTATNRLNASGSAFCIFQNLSFTVAGAGVSNSVLATGSCVCIQCYATNPSTNSSAQGISTAIAINCEGALTGGSGGTCGIGVSTAAIGCRVVQSQADGIRISLSSGVAYGNTVANCGGDGIKFTSTSVSSTLFAMANTVDDCTGNGISVASAAFTSLTLISLNNHVTDSGANGFYSNYDGTAQIVGCFLNNRTRTNTTAAINGFDDWAAATTIGHVTSGSTDADDFTNAGSNDYSLIASSAAKGVGLIPYLDIGGIQRAEAAGLLVNPGMDGGLS